MGEPNRSSYLQPIAPAGATFYLLDLSNIPSGVPETHPLHLIFSEVDQRSLLPLKPREIHTQSTSNNSLNRATVIKPLSCLETPAVKQFETVNNFSNEKITLHTLTHNVQVGNLKKQIHSKSIQSHEVTQENVQQVIKNKEEIKKIPNYHHQHYLQPILHISDRVVPPRAIAVLPKALHMRRDSIFPKRALPPRARFGPVQGVVQKIFPAEADELVYEASVAEKPIFLMKREENSVTYINVSDKERSNWLSLLPLGKTGTANVWLYEEDNELYGITTKLIPSRTPLSLGYSKKYAIEHKLSSEQPILDLDKVMAEEPKWWCFECRRDLGSSTLLLRHMNINHKEDKPSRRKYRCSYCSRSFCRLFTLRRHMSKICAKKPVKSSPIAPHIEPKRVETDICISQSTEDNRIPSDESFQNYTSALDFSTNLFDPDRISNLDISGSIRSEELNPFSSGMKFETFVNNDNNEDYSKFCKGLTSENDSKNKTKSEDLTVVNCPHCKETLTRSKKRRHLRDCPARRLQCECGKVFTRRDDFAKHVYLNHNRLLSDTQTKEEPSKTDAKETAYKCDKCKVKFKRRGMLVNHLWRVHNTTATKVPLERSVRHYPCAVCPKIYRTAAKRDRHVQNHHPGAQIRAAPIEGEKRRCQPAKCSVCPREYVTRSKLLQHIRAHHPELGVATTK